MLRLKEQRGVSFLPLLLLLLLLLSTGDGKPHMAPGEEPGVSSEGAQLLEALKTGILSSLGMDEEPRGAHRASEEELREMYRLYWDKLTEMRGNSSQPVREASSVLSPVTVELLKVLQSGSGKQPGHLMLWYRAVFHKTPNIQTQLMLTRAELKISRQLINGPAMRRKVKVRINGTEVTNTSAWTSGEQAAGAGKGRTDQTTVDIRPEVEAWLQRSDGGSLIVDVGMTVRGDHLPSTNPDISLELEPMELQSAPKSRLPRSTKEDVCNEQGWCCRRSVTVSFKDIGWTDWVVAPAQYTMHYCDGSCPHNYKPASMHTQVKSHMHRISKGALPGPCCVPAAYEPMVLMHYDSRGKLTLTPFDDLIVSKCHCA